MPMDPAMVKKTRELEMQYMDELQVLEASYRDTDMAGRGRPPIPTDWVDLDIGDSSRNNHMRRLVWRIWHRRSPRLPLRSFSSSTELADDRSEVGGPRGRRGVDAVGYFPERIVTHRLRDLSL